MPNDIVIIPGSKVITFQDGNNTVQRLSITGSGLKFTGAITSSKLSITNNLIIDGNLGIGTSNPAKLFDVRGATASGQYVSTTGTNISFHAFSNTGGGVLVGKEGSAGSAVFLGTSPYSAVFGTDSAYPIGFATNNTEVVRITTSGSVGIGTNSPAAKLQIQNTGDVAYLVLNTTATGNKRVRLQFTQNNNAGLELATDYNLDTSNDFYLYDRVNAQAFALFSYDKSWFSGNVGIGSVNPAYKLDVSPDTSTVRLGRLLTGAWPAGNTYAFFGNTSLDHTGGGNYALLQYTDGTTFLNAATGTAIYFRIANATKMMMDSNGNLGIGTTVMSAPLVLNASTTTSTTVGNKENRIFFKNYSVTANNGAEIVIGAEDTATGRYASIGTDIKSNASGNAIGDVYIATKTATSDTSLTRRLVVQANGNVGIGTSSPNTALHVITTTATGSRIQLGTDNTNSLMDANKTNDLLVLNAPWGSNAESVSNAGAKWGIKFIGSIASGYDNTKTSAIYAVSEDTLGYNRGTSLAFYTNQLADGVYAERMRIFHNGNVGIGTSSPTQRLDLSGSLRIKSSGTYSDPVDNAGFLNYDAQGGVFTISARSSGGSTYMAFRTSNSGTAGERMRINSDGNVGIGTTSVGTRLTVADSSPTIRLTDTNTNVTGGVYGTIDWLSSDSSAPGGLVAKIDVLDDSGTYGDRGALRFFTNNATSLGERMRIKSDGNVGIGTTSPSARLHVSSSARFDGVISQNNYYRRKVIALSYPGASFGAYRQYIRLWPASGGGSNLFSLRVTLNGEWNYAPIFGELKADYSLYLPGDNTISTVRDFRVSFLNYPAASHLRIEDAVIENGYVSIPVYASDSSIIYATIEQWGGNEILASTTSAVSTILPSTKFQSTYLGLNVNTGSNLSNCYLTLRSSNTERFGISNGTTTANIYPASGVFYITTETNHPISFITNGSEKMRIAADGNIGIGTTSPSKTLQVAGTGAFTSDLTTGYGTFTTPGLIIGDGQYGFYVSGGNLYYKSSSGGVHYWRNIANTLNIMSLDNSGNLLVTGNIGIGTTSATHKLQVTGSNSSKLLLVQSPRATSALFVSGSGNVGVGTSVPSSRLHTYGSGSNLSVFKAEGGNGTLFEVTDNLSGSLFSVNDITGLPILEVFSNNRVVAGKFAANDFVISGSRVGIGTSTPAAKLEVSGSVLDYTTFNRRTSNYTMSLSDASKLIEMNVASANTVNVPTNAQVAFKIGTKVDVVQYGAGQTTITGSAGGGVQIRTANNYYKINARYGAATLTKVGTNEWYMFGNLSA